VSYVQKDKLRGTDDPNIPYVTSDLAFTTAVSVTDTLTQHYALAKKFRIVNQDGTNSLTYKQGSKDGVSKPVPPNSEVIVSGWESFIQITPNAASGLGFLEMDLVTLDNAKKV
jgi:hypothetical protein